MPSLRELRKHLKSITTTEQLAGAMKTVSAAKFSRISAVLDGYRPYADTCRVLLERFGLQLAEVMPCVNPDAPACYVVMASNRGLCGGYNIALLDFAGELLASVKEPYLLVACGKMAIAHFEGKANRTFVLPDVPDYNSCAELCDYLRKAYTGGEVSAVYLIYQDFVNMLKQTPTFERLLPLADVQNIAHAPMKPADDMLYVPDRETVLRNACLSCVNASLYSVILEAAAGAQAATLMAMRSAYDNAQESSAALETVISRKRQGEVTASVLETSSDKNTMNNPQ